MALTNHCIVMIKLIWDLNLNRFVTRIGNTTRVESIDLQRQKTVMVVVTVVQDDKPVNVGDEIGLSIKSAYNADALALASLEWDAAEGVYSGDLDLFTTGIEALFANGEECVGLISGIGYEDEGGEIKPSETLDVVIRNSVHLESEPTPTPSPTADAWLSDRAVRYDKSQSLSDSQRWAALQNLGFSVGADPVLGAGLRIKLADGTTLQLTGNIVSA